MNANQAAAAMHEAQEDLNWSLCAVRHGYGFFELLVRIAEFQQWQAQEALRQIKPANDCGERAA